MAETAAALAARLGGAFRGSAYFNAMNGVGKDNVVADGDSASMRARALPRPSRAPRHSTSPSRARPLTASPLPLLPAPPRPFPRRSVAVRPARRGA